MVTSVRASSPHYLLFSETSSAAPGCGRWRFVLQRVGGGRRLVASDVEPGTSRSRLELLATVRGLEAIDQPARVTLLTKSRYVSRGIRRELGAWRDRHWKWELFGRVVPIRDDDLWRRVDRALEYHEVDCSAWQFAADAQTAGADQPIAAGDGLDWTKPELENSPAMLIVPRPVRARDAWARRRDDASGWQEPGWRQRITEILAAWWRPACTRAA